MVESISFCLVVALLLGLVIAWFLLRRDTTNTEESKSQTLNSIITEKEKRVEELESAYIEKKNQLNRLVDEGIVCRHQLLQKSNVLRKKSDELYRVQEKLDRVKEKIAYIENKISKQKESKEESSSSELPIEIKRLEDIIAKRDKSITILKGSVEELTDDNYIQISKDQFEQIEKKLKDYNNRVDELENENSKLLAMSRLKKEPRVLEDITLYLSNLKESTLSSFYSKRAKA
jgi:chromosome segregation ATPase